MNKKERRVLEGFFSTLDRTLPQSTHLANLKIEAKSYKLSVTAIAHAVVTLEYLYGCGGTLKDAMSVWC